MNGPSLVFDKSTLQSLNRDEATWLDSFFSTNITPLLYVETLADLEKQMRDGRAPEAVVAGLASKTPVMASYPNVHHSALVIGDLLGNAVRMKLLPVVGGGVTVALPNKNGVFFQQAPEAIALERWRERQFLQLEREFARAWRSNLSALDLKPLRDLYQGWLQVAGKPRDLSAARDSANRFIASAPRTDESFHVTLEMLQVPQKRWEAVTTRWNDAGCPALA